MERRNWSLKALEKLIYINSLDDEPRALNLISWSQDYLTTDITDFDLEISDLGQLTELFFANIIFLKNYKKITKNNLDEVTKMRKYLKH